jgi:hypothetical protein
MHPLPEEIKLALTLGALLVLALVALVSGR